MRYIFACGYYYCNKSDVRFPELNSGRESGGILSKCLKPQKKSFLPPRSLFMKGSIIWGCRWHLWSSPWNETFSFRISYLTTLTCKKAHFWNKIHLSVWQSYSIFEINPVFYVHRFPLFLFFLLCSLLIFIFQIPSCPHEVSSFLFPFILPSLVTDHIVISVPSFIRCVLLG